MVFALSSTLMYLVSLPSEAPIISPASYTFHVLPVVTLVPLSQAFLSSASMFVPGKYLAGPFCVDLTTSCQLLFLFIGGETCLLPCGVQAKSFAGISHQLILFNPEGSIQLLGSCTYPYKAIPPFNPMGS